MFQISIFVDFSHALDTIDFDILLRKLKLDGWCTANGIKMNTDKTKLMWFGGAKKLKELPDPEIVVDGTPILTVNSYKYLGVTLDGQLNYSKHIGRLIAGASVKLRQFRRMRSFLNTRAAVLVYKSMLLPLLEYGDIFLGGATVENRKKTTNSPEQRTAMCTDEGQRREH